MFMKNKQTYVKVAIIVAIVGTVLMVILSTILNKNQEKRDPMILKYNEVMYELSVDENTYHAKEEIVSTDVNGNVISKSNNEYYNDHTNFLAIKRYGEDDDVYHEFVYNGYSYSYNVDGDEYYANKHEMAGGYYARPIISVSHSYFALDDKCITYEETETGYIFRCDNQTKVGTGYNSNGNSISHVCDSAVAEIYLDKDWNIQKIFIEEEWTQIDEDGIETESVSNTSIVFSETSEEEVRAYLEDEYELIESLLK